MRARCLHGTEKTTFRKWNDDDVGNGNGNDEDDDDDDDVDAYTRKTVEKVLIAFFHEFCANKKQMSPRNRRILTNFLPLQRIQMFWKGSFFVSPSAGVLQATCFEIK